MRQIDVSYDENQSEEYNKFLKESVNRLGSLYVESISFMGASGVATLASLATFPQNPEYRTACFSISAILTIAKGIEFVVENLRAVKEVVNKLEELRK